MIAKLGRSKHFAIATTIVIAVIVYGSLYPFAFRPADDGIGPVLRALWESRAERPGRVTFLANILLYMPLGFFAIHALGRRGGAAGRMVLITLLGVFLSVSMELLQYFDEGRVTDAPDVYANTLGTLIGAGAGSLLTESIRWPFLSKIAVARVPTLLLAAWVGYRLFPFVPTLDLHKYWSAIKPVIIDPDPTYYDLLRYTAMWLGIGALIEAIGWYATRVAVLFAVHRRHFGRQDHDRRCDAKCWRNSGRSRGDRRVDRPWAPPSFPYHRDCALFLRLGRGRAA